MAQASDPCDDADAIMGISEQRDGPTLFYAVRGADLELVGSVPGELNALAYADGFAYALREESNVVLKLSLADGVSVVDSFGVTGMPARRYRAGAVRPGTPDYYATARDIAKYRLIPLDQGGEGYSNVEITGKGTKIDVGDAAFWNDLLVGYDSDIGALLHFDPDTGNSWYVETPDLPAAIYGAAYVVGPSLFLYSDTEKSIYELDPSDGGVLGRVPVPLMEPTRQIDAASCANEPVAPACAPILDLRADVLALALPAVVRDELLSELDAALFNCSRGEYTLTAAALARFLAVVGLNAGVTIDLSDSELLTSVAQSLISGLPEDTTGNPCTPILDLRADVLGLGLSGPLQDALLADLNAALISCAAGAIPDLLAALNSFIGTVTLNTVPLGEISLLESTALIASAQAIISVFPRNVAADWSRESSKGAGALEAASARREASVLGDVVQTKVFPNPATTRAIVQAPGPFEARVYDLVGRLVLEVEATSSTAEVSVRDLSPGLYLVRISAADGMHTAKITVGE